MSGHCFLSYSRIDGQALALSLYDALKGGPERFGVWMDHYDLGPGDWPDQIEESIATCDSLLLLITPDSVSRSSNCREEWSYAIRCKKPVIPLIANLDVEVPYRLQNRQYVDLVTSFDSGLAKLRQYLRRLRSAEGQLEQLRLQLEDAERELTRPGDALREARVRKTIEALTLQIRATEAALAHPQRADARREAVMDLSRPAAGPAAPPAEGPQPAFQVVNPPPFLPPNHFQNRYSETGLLAEFLADPAQRILVVCGRGGIGKTAMVCRFLRALEHGQLPDDRGPATVSGIVYLSGNGAYRVTFPNLFYSLLRLLPESDATRLDTLYQQSQAGDEQKMEKLLEALAGRGTVVNLLDNFEDVLDPEARTLTDSALDAALRAIAHFSHHGLKVIITSRIVPRDLPLVEPGRYFQISLDEGLDSPFAENLLRRLDRDGALGLRDAPEALLRRARDFTRGYPRALEALYSILAADRDSTVEEILAKAQGRLTEHITEALVGQAYNRLDRAAQQVLQGLAVFGRPVPAAAVDYALSDFFPVVDSGPILSRLVSMYFVRREAAGRYYLHPLDRSYALSRIPVDMETRLPETEEHDAFSLRALQNAAAGYFQEIQKPRQEWKDLDSLAPQLAELDLRLEAEDFSQAFWILREIAWDHLIQWGHAGLVLDLAKRLEGRLDTEEELQRLNIVGSALTRIGRIRRALEIHEEGIALAKRTGNKNWQISHRANLASGLRMIDRPEEAYEILTELLPVLRSLGDRKHVAVVLSNIGFCLRDVGKVREAIDHHEEALSIYRMLGNPHGEEGELHNHALCLLKVGGVERAAEQFREALKLSPETGDRLWEANHRTALAGCLRLWGQPLEARKLIEESLAIRREVGDLDGEAWDLEALAWVDIEEGNLTAAISHLKSALALATDLQLPVRSKLKSLSWAHLQLDDITNAQSALKKAIVDCAPTHREFPNLLDGIIALREGGAATARAAFERALVQAELLLGLCPEAYDPWETKALSLAGLALCGAVSDLGPAKVAIETARSILAAPGAVAVLGRQLGSLRRVDPEGMLAPLVLANRSAVPEH